MEHNVIRSAPGAATDEPASPSNPAPGAADPLGFEPVDVRYRTDGWTPAKQREYVEALADLGVAKWAAARVGLTVQSANRLRRRADARGFDLACEAAERIGRRRIVSLAFERAIEGQVKRHYYRGELIGEERVYDNRLLVAALPRLLAVEEPSRESLAVERNWQPWLDAIERGDDPAAPKVRAAEPDLPFAGCSCWDDEDGRWWTDFPPPEGFDGEEEGDWGDDYYRRTLTPEEAAFVQLALDEGRAEDLAAARAARDVYFGFTPAAERIEVKGSAGPLPRRTGCELSEPSELSGVAASSPPRHRRRRRGGRGGEGDLEDREHRDRARGDRDEVEQHQGEGAVAVVVDIILDHHLEPVAGVDEGRADQEQHRDRRPGIGEPFADRAVIERAEPEQRDEQPGDEADEGDRGRPLLPPMPGAFAGRAEAAHARQRTFHLHRLSSLPDPQPQRGGEQERACQGRQRPEFVAAELEARADVHDQVPKPRQNVLEQGPGQADADQD